MHLTDIAEGTTVEEIRAMTEAIFVVDEDLKTF